MSRFEFGQQLRQARERFGLTVEAAAQWLGVSALDFHDTENGFRQMTPERITQIERGWGLTPGTLHVPAAKLRGFVEVPTSADRAKQTEAAVKLALFTGVLTDEEAARILEVLDAAAPRVQPGKASP